MRLVPVSLLVLLAACGAQEKDLPAADTSGVTDTADTGTDDTSAEDTATEDTNDTVDTGADTSDTGTTDTADSGADTSDTGTDTSDTGATDTSDTGTTDTSSRDVDGDGYTVADGDCDDSNPAVNPGEREVPDNRIDEDCDGTVAVTPPPSYTFAADVLPILRTSCQSCHSGRSPSGGLNMSDSLAFANLINQGSGQLRGMDLVEPGDSTRSYLALKIQNTHRAAGGSGTQMPPSTSLTRENVAIITSWIDAGAVER
jgi:hypothetical protein